MFHFSDKDTDPRSAARHLGTYGLSFATAKRNIRRMATGVIRLSSRLALFVCGMISILLSRAFRSLQGAMTAVHVSWRLFAVALALIGGASAVIALLPSLWLERACYSGPAIEHRSRVPNKLFAGFAVFSYLVTVGLNFIPLSWHLPADTIYSACPSCVLTITVDPSLGTVALVLAPLNAAVYGALGALLGYSFLAVRNRL
jgi:hypothetical protein